MDTYYELFDLESGNVIEDYASEHEAIDALAQVVTEHGTQAIASFALTYVEDGTPVLVAMQEELVRLVEHELVQLLAQRRSS